jgi:hypothetical protein
MKNGRNVAEGGEKKYFFKIKLGWLNFICLCTLIRIIIKITFCSYSTRLIYITKNPSCSHLKIRFDYNHT